MNIRPFHVAFPATELAKLVTYETILGCMVGRTSDTWIDFNLFGHQVTAHLCPTESRETPTNPVDGKKVPVQHWGVILSMEQWQALAEN
jgi:extradiol dioxygenase family protein